MKIPSNAIIQDEKLPNTTLKKKDYIVVGWALPTLLEGVNAKKLSVITVWQKRKADNKFYFITLKPYRG